MSALSIQPTYPIFTDIDGQPLEDGFVWIDQANLDPQVNPINVFWDAALTIPAGQPIRTLGGYPANSGTPARLYVNSDYSIRVMNKNGSVVYSAPAATERYSDVVVSGVNAEDVIYDPPFIGGVQTNVEAKLAQTVSVKDFGAVGDGVTDDTAAIQAAIDAASGAVFFPETDAFYKITDTLTISKNFFSLEGVGQKSVIQNSGASKVAVKVTAQQVSIRNLAILGDGGAFGVGATTSHGIEFDGATNWSVFNCSIRYHGGHGIYCTGGVWITNVDKCDITQNYGDGINSVSPSGAATDQNGNNFSLTNSSISLNTGSGVNWKASSVNVSGCTIEANKEYGFKVNTTGLTNSAFGVSIQGNFFENNVLGEINFTVVSGVVLSAACITGNYFYSVQSGPTAFITCAGPIRSIQSLFVAGNSCVLGGTVAHLLNGGSALREDCTLVPGAYTTTAIGYAKLVQGSKTKVLLGPWSQTGLTWTDPSGPSDNFFSAGTVTVYFDLNLTETDLLWDIKFYVTSNTTAQYVGNAFIFAADPTTGAAVSNLYSTSILSDAGGGNKLFTITPTVTNMPIRVGNNQKIYLRLQFSPPSTGSTIQMYDPVVRFV